MLKKTVLAAAGIAVLGMGAAAPAIAGPLSGPMGDSMNCRKLAKQHYPDDRGMRKAMRSDCKAYQKQSSKMDKAAKRAAS
ncbi:hypothetical protein V6C03_04745 [Methyloligella sp. 2.7D]|uniref:hypothetical protein n=1 Tax=unclassified Methyloligella TaxID=2625955 RepID=UPI00157DB0D9|nr:hypothetical protein [Methyloligella sp. GL2]QKP76098.1 hypothetical protein HT051_00685 [Methyloligella sp. GL2]